MSDERLIHITVENGTENELKRLRNWAEDALEDFEGHGKIIVTDDRTDLKDVPAFDNFADEIAERVAERVQE